MTNNLLHTFSICLAKPARTRSKNTKGNSTVLSMLHILCGHQACDMLSLDQCTQ
jgi:hypothetical protein